MGTARIVTVGDLILQANYELRNTGQRQYIEAEMIAYVNKACELIHNILVDEDSPIVRTGSGQLVTEAGVAEYSLEDNQLSDLWLPYRVWTPGSDPLELVDEDLGYEYERAEADGATDARLEPTMFYLLADKVGFLPYPDDAYTYYFKYYPNFIPKQDADDPVPFLNLFNLQIVEAVKIYAKNRENSPLGVEAALMELFQARALALSRKREGRSQAITIRKR